jgi:hypothetical protein
MEFWIHGGPLGGQTITVTLTRAINPSTSTVNISPQNMGFSTLPPNRWIKVSSTQTITSNSANKFSLVIFSNALPQNGLVLNNYTALQNTLYIDDVRFIGKTVLSVTDSTGCTASTPVARVTTPPLLTQTIHVTNAKCFNNTDGVVAVSMDGGQPPYHYQWSTTEEDGATASGLPESVVYLNLSDTNNCKFVPVNTTVLQPPRMYYYSLMINLHSTE